MKYISFICFVSRNISQEVIGPLTHGEKHRQGRKNKGENINKINYRKNDSIFVVNFDFFLQRFQLKIIPSIQWDSADRELCQLMQKNKFLNPLL